MARQDYTGPVRWVIVDDGADPQPVTFKRDGWELIIVRPRPYWRPGQNTQHRNMLAGLEHIPHGEPLAFIEDDDYYAADWLTTVAGKLEQHDLIGMVPNRYYNVRTRQPHECENVRHSSLCSTAIKGATNYGVLKRQCELGRKLVDLQLWKHCQNRHVFESGQVIGMKALPGRPGIAYGHKMDPGPTMPLAEWIGDDAAMYEEFHAV